MKGPLATIIASYVIIGITGSDVFEAKFIGDIEGIFKFEESQVSISLQTPEDSGSYKWVLYKEKCGVESDVSDEMKDNLPPFENNTLVTSIPLDNSVDISEVKSVSIEKCNVVNGIGETSTETCEEVGCANTTCANCTDWVLVILIIAGVILLIILVICVVIVCCLRKRKTRELLVGDVSPSSTCKTVPSEVSDRKSPTIYDSSLSIPFIDASLPPTPKIGRTVNGLDILLGNDTNSLNSSDAQ